MQKMRVLPAMVFAIMLAAGVVGMTFTARAAATPGSLIKRADSSAVYYYSSNGKRYVFPNERVFRTWYVDFASIQTVSAAELSSIQIGGNVTYRPGFRMIKIDTDPKVYAISRGGVLRPIASEAVAAAIFGPHWASLIDDIPDAFFVNYAMGAPVTTAADFNRENELASAVSINSDKNMGDVPATAPLPVPPTTNASCVEDSWYCTQWNACSASGTQTRFCNKTLDCAGVETPSPATTQSCGATPTCTADEWYCTQWDACSASGTQTRFCNKTFDCAAAETPSPATTQSCTPPATPPSCTADTWYCTDWYSCSPSGSQARNCSMTYDCPTAVTPMPATTQSCSPTPTCTADEWYCTQWNACSMSGSQTRFCNKTLDCAGVDTPSPATTQSCTYAGCTADTWTCTEWSACTQGSVNQYRSCSMTSDCAGVDTPMPAYMQSCTP